MMLFLLSCFVKAKTHAVQCMAAYFMQPIYGLVECHVAYMNYWSVISVAMENDLLFYYGVKEISKRCHWSPRGYMLCV